LTSTRRTPKNSRRATQTLFFLTGPGTLATTGCSTRKPRWSRRPLRG
jgi:hypothetical protein